MEKSQRRTIGPISPFFISSDVPRAVEFYCEGLGFEVRFAEPSEGPFFAIVGRDGVQIYLKDPRRGHSEAIRPQPNPTRHEWAPWDAFVFVADPDALAAEFASRAAGLPTEIRDREDGLRGFEIRDPDGYVLFFGRPA